MRGMSNCSYQGPRPQALHRLQQNHFLKHTSTNTGWKPISGMRAEFDCATRSPLRHICGLVRECASACVCHVILCRYCSCKFLSMLSFTFPADCSSPCGCSKYTQNALAKFLRRRTRTCSGVDVISPCYLELLSGSGASQGHMTTNSLLSQLSAGRS